LQKLKIYQSLWGMEQRIPGKTEPTIKQSFEKVKKAQFDGICIDLAVHEIEQFQETKDFYEEFNLECMVNAFPYNPSDMKPLMKMAKDFNASLVNVISGVTPLVPIEAIPLVRRWMDEAAELEIKVLFETHRDSLLNDLFFTIQLMDLVPEMRLCADLSHFVIDRELRLPLPKRDELFMNSILGRSDCLQGRVANREQIQIQIDFPQHQEWVVQFKNWWKQGIKNWRNRNDENAELIFLCELGPRPYAMTDKNQEELSDRWEEALKIRAWIEKIWQEVEQE